MGRIIGGAGICSFLIGVSIFESAMAFGGMLIALGLAAIYYVYKEYEL